jgi:dGTP triphosphohydrolase
MGITMYSSERTNMQKRAYSVQMNFQVPDSEKRVAEKAEEYFEQLLAQMQDASDYLDIIYNPFQKRQNVDIEMIVEYRKTFRQYRDQAKRKFSSIIKKSYRAVALMNEFSIDTATEELMDSFIGSVRELEKYIDTFVSIFSNMNSSEFRNHLVSTIDSIKKQLNQIRQLVTDRVLEHIDSNILAKDWAKDLSERFDEPLEERVPLVVQLFRERQKVLKDRES